MPQDLSCAHIKFQKRSKSLRNLTAIFSYPWLFYLMHDPQSQCFKNFFMKSKNYPITLLRESR